MYVWLNPDATGSNQRIVIDAGRIESLAQSFERTWNRKPSASELARLVDDFALEEIYTRQAIAMGLDQNDAVIRRRLRQKLEFLTTSVASVNRPDEGELQRFLVQHSEEYRAPNRYSFQQVYVNPTRSATDLDQRLAEVEDALSQGESISGDESLISPEFNDASSTYIDSTLGRGFAAQLDELALNEWSGPLRSGVGFHFVRLSAREPGAVPPLDAIRTAVLRDWTYERESQAREEIEEELLASYEVVVRWPETNGAR